MAEAITTNNDYYMPDKNDNKPKDFSDPDIFLKILVAQMKYQNPMQPTDSETFIGQITQMATMEQMAKVSTNMENMAAQYEMSQCYELVGRQVMLVKGDEVITGTVGGVVVEDNKPYFYLAGSFSGETYSLDQVKEVAGGTDNDILPYLALAGHLVKVGRDGNIISGHIEKVLLQNGAAAIEVNGEIYAIGEIMEIMTLPDEEPPEEGETDNPVDEEETPPVDEQESDL